MFIAAACASVALLAGADAQAVSAAGQIACVRQTSIGQEIWLMSDAGARLHRLTRARSGDYTQNWPAWKPGGALLAYVDWAYVTNDTGARLWAVSADGSGAHRLLPDGALGDMESVAGWLCGPAWSVDGDRIAFINTMNVAQGDPSQMWQCLVTYDFTTGTAARLYRLPRGWQIRGLTWSRSGRTIEFVIDNSALHTDGRSPQARASGLRSFLRSVDTTNGAVRTLATAPKGTLWSGIARSPGGGKVAITQTPWLGGRAALKLAPMGGTPNRTLVRASRFDTLYSSPTWSRDGKRIAYGLGSPNGNSVWIVRADGSGDHKAILKAAMPAWRVR
jgi:Tol biopolymer transport system component